VACRKSLIPSATRAGSLQERNGLILCAAHPVGMTQMCGGTSCRGFPTLFDHLARRNEAGVSDLCPLCTKSTVVSSGTVRVDRIRLSVKSRLRQRRWLRTPLRSWSSCKRVEWREIKRGWRIQPPHPQASGRQGGIGQSRGGRAPLPITSPHQQLRARQSVAGP